ncbi:MAG: hypothetical protein H0X64_13805 [Gemmatimonadaceae bacterium]|nr:hypothetical protein [Gemmatimonadaceae bacterium]
MRYRLVRSLLVSAAIVALGPIFASARAQADSAALAAVVRGEATRFDFKGAKLGDSISLRRTTNGCERDNELRTHICLGQERINDVEVWVGLSYLDGRIWRVSFMYDADDFSKLLPAFTAKYGQPLSVSVEPFKTVGGAEYSNQVVIWRMHEGTLELRQRASRSDEGRGSINDAAAVLELEKRRRAKAANAAKRDM